MSTRPSRAKMCNWLSAALHAIDVRPSNPADIAGIVVRSRATEKKLADLSVIASEMGWHADASLDLAWTLIQDYDAERDAERTARQAEPALNRTFSERVAEAKRVAVDPENWHQEWAEREALNRTKEGHL